MNICEFKSSTYSGNNVAEIECKKSSKGVVKHPYQNIHENWRKYVKAYFERLSYMNKDHHSFDLELY